MKGTFEETTKQLCQDLGLDADKFLAYCQEDEVGGYPEKWEVGSIWAVEGKILYALTRILKPETALEFGTRHGCSTAHFCAALDRNGHGSVTTVDVLDFEPNARTHPRVWQVVSEGVTFAQQWHEPIDFVFEDGPHSTEFTRDVIRLCLPNLKPGGIVVVHDACHYIVGKQVSQGLREAVGDFGAILSEPSDCGLGYWRKPGGR